MAAGEARPERMIGGEEAPSPSPPKPVMPPPVVLSSH